MHLIRLNINDTVYDKFMWLLSKFSKEEVEIVTDEIEFQKNKLYLEAELDEILSGKAKFIEIDEAEKLLDKVIKKNEDLFQS